MTLARKIGGFALGVLTGAYALGCGGEASRANVVIVQPADQVVVTGPDVRIVLQARGVEIVPAGVQTPNSGHHHLFIDQDITSTGEPIPAGVSGIVHLGGGQTEYVVEGLGPGEHRVIAQLGDWQHVPAESVGADTVRFTVQQ